MSKKIKEIDIDAFRAYKDMQKFNFVHNSTGEIANLVAIYAPNGYGKTSFFDAVEWAITDEIGRLKGEKPVIEEVKKEKDYILKNRDSKAECGTVKIVAEDGAILEVKTVKKKGNMKGDYKKGNVEIVSKEILSILNEKETFCTTNLLAHDKITGFLQRYTDKEKVNQLSVMWDENNYAEIVQEVTGIYEEIERKRKLLSGEIVKKERELEKYKYESSQHDKIKKIISDYEKKYGVSIVNNEDLISDPDELLLKFKEVYTQTEMIKGEIEEKYNVADILEKDYEVYAEQKRKFSLKVQQKTEIEQCLTLCEAFEKERVKYDRLNKELERMKYLLSITDEYCDTVKKVCQNNAELKTLEKESFSFQKEKIDIAAEIEALELCVKKGAEDEVNLDEKIKNLQGDLKKHQNYRQEEIKYSKLSGKAKVLLDKREERLNCILSNINRLVQFSDKRMDIVDIQDLFTKDNIDQCLKLKKLKGERNLIDENNEILESNRKNIIYLLDRMEQLAVLGRDIVSETEYKECPLCHAEYSSSKFLLERINNKSLSNEELHKIDIQLQKNKEQEQIIEAEIIKLKQDIDIIIEAIQKESEEKYVKEDTKYNKIKSWLKKWDGIVNDAVFERQKLLIKYREEALCISNYEEVEGRLEILRNEKAALEEKTRECTKQLKKCNERIGEIIKKIQELELKKIAISESNNNILISQVYTVLEDFLESKEISKEEFSSKKIRLVIENEYNKLVAQKNEILENMQIYQDKNLESRGDYEEKLEIMQRELNELKVNIDSFLTRCNRTMEICEDKGDILKEIGQFRKELGDKKKISDEKLKIEKNILSNINALKEQKMWLDQVQENNKKKRRVEFLSKRLEKLSESKNFIEDFVVKRTNEYFDADVINQIYSRIDPHPTMKHIRFDTQKDATGLKTHIYTYDDSEKNRMSPVLYLSSAQVNILSLCIFLAKVLSEKNTTFNTIFMDDPIQHLDGINLLAFIDVLRTITTEMGRQVVISTHNEQFYKLLKVKMDADYFSSKFIELGSAGIIK